ncbi:hypothetical protein BJ138DRAFT_1150051 [Hygrophoropsis aurantiaca]|uniref:Uncharacterized protein n=1 Tax=Hygrophoropsis aurantiaca TaxID=72124 RepID=A0ACB8AEH3_9AGAM|nr:hypothetical protein BJ138DRAFT_1150051 [Hygrophoropsis aurantiaca]
MIELHWCWPGVLGCYRHCLFVVMFELVVSQVECCKYAQHGQHPRNTRYCILVDSVMLASSIAMISSPNHIHI